MPRRKNALDEAIDVARRGMLDPKSSAAVRLRYMDRFCLLNKIYSVALEDKDGGGGIKPEDIDIPTLTKVKETLAEFDAYQKKTICPPPQAPSADIANYENEINRMLQTPAPVASKPTPTYEGFSDIALMRNEHMQPKGKKDDWD